MRIPFEQAVDAVNIDGNVLFLNHLASGSEMTIMVGTGAAFFNNGSRVFPPETNQKVSAVIIKK
jgi:hypothetical protein